MPPLRPLPLLRLPPSNNGVKSKVVSGVNLKLHIIGWTERPTRFFLPKIP